MITMQNDMDSPYVRTFSLEDMLAKRLIRFQAMLSFQPRRTCLVRLLL